MRLPSRAAATATLAALPPRNLPKDVDVFEADADLQRIDVDAASPDGEDVEFLISWSVKIDSRSVWVDLSATRCAWCRIDCAPRSPRHVNSLS